RMDGTKQEIHSPKEQVSSFSLSPNGSRLAIGRYASDIEIYDTTTGNRLTTLGGQTGATRGMTFTSDGKRLAAGSEDRTVFIWDIESKAILHKTALQDAAWSLDFFPDGKSLAIGTLDGLVTLWNMSPPEDATTLLIPNGLGELRFTPDDRSIVAVGY